MPLNLNSIKIINKRAILAKQGPAVLKRAKATLSQLQVRNVKRN